MSPVSVIRTFCKGAVAVIAAALFIVFRGNAAADFTPRGILAEIAGFDDSLSAGNRAAAIRYHPSTLLDDRGSYMETFFIHREILRTFTGEEKDILASEGGIGFRHDTVPGRAGWYAAWIERSSSVSWPFSDDRVKAYQYFHDGMLHVAGYGRLGIVRMGVSLGASAVGGADRIERAFDVASSLPRGITLRAEYALVPYEWGVRGTFKDIAQVLPADFTVERSEISLTAPLSHVAVATLTFGAETLYTLPNDCARSGGHAQIWTGNRLRWDAVIREACLPVVDASVGFGGSDIDGNLGLSFNGIDYARAEATFDMARYFLSLGAEDGPRWFPAFRYDRADTRGRQPYGFIDSWAFTPQQIAIFGDKTWTFQGRGRVISDGLTANWLVTSLGAFRLGWRRLHYDYRLKIIERDHFPLDPLHWLIGKHRTVTDDISYYDIAVGGYEGSIHRGGVTCTFGIEQLAPVRTVRAAKQGQPPIEPEVPKLNMFHFKQFGGLSIRLNVKFVL